MSNGMRSVTLRKGILHVETPEGIVNIEVGLHDREGRSVVNVSARPDDYPGELRVRCSPGCGFRMIRNKRLKPRR